MAGLTGLFNDLAAPAAIRALGDAHHLAVTYVLRAPDLTGPPAGGAVPEVTGLCTRSMADRAYGMMRDRNGIFRAIERIGKGYFNVIPEICPRPLPCPPGSPGKSIENIPETKVPEQVLVTGWSGSPGSIAGSELDMTHLVVLGFLLGIA